MNQRLAILWRRHLEDLSASLLPIGKWCELQGVSRGRVTYWKRKLAGEDTAALPPQSGRFVSVAVVEPAPAPHLVRRGGLTLRIGGASLDIEAGFDPATLRAVVSALEGRPC